MNLLTNLISYWRLWEPSGIRVDSAGLNSLSSNNNVARADGLQGYAAQFVAASSQSLSIADNAALSTGDIDFSLVTWVYLDTKTGFRDLAGKWGAAGQFEYIIFYNSGADRLTFGVSSDGALPGYSYVEANTFGSPSTGTWYLVGAYHDSVGNAIGINVNNGVIDTVAHSTGVFNSTSAFILGARDDLAGVNYHDGRLAGVGFWKRLLSADDRSALYNNGKGIISPFPAHPIAATKVRPRPFAPGLAR